MLSITRSMLPRSKIIAPRISSVLGSDRLFSIAADLAMKEKVEEDRFIRSKEHEDYLRRKASEPPPVLQLTPEEEAAKLEHETAVDEAFEILSRLGCKVEDSTIEALADWKLGRN